MEMLLDPFTVRSVYSRQMPPHTSILSHAWLERDGPPQPLPCAHACSSFTFTIVLSLSRDLESGQASSLQAHLFAHGLCGEVRATTHSPPVRQNSLSRSSLEPEGQVTRNAKPTRRHINFGLLWGSLILSESPAGRAGWSLI